MSIAKLLPTMLSFTTSVLSATYYVAQDAPNASDENPGREQQPWKTLTHAAETAQEGDTIYIKAGTYRQQLKPENDGVTFLAFGDDRVVLTPDDKITLIEPGAWSKAPDQEFVYACEPEVEGGEKMLAKTSSFVGKLLRVDGLAVAFEVTQGIRREVISSITEMREVEVDRTLEDDDGRRWSVDREGRLYLNLEGEDPAKHRVELIEEGIGGVRLPGNNGRVKGLELHDCGISIGGQGNIVSDCLVLKGITKVKGSGSVVGKNIIRRCAFYRCRSIHVGTNAVFEENLVVGSLRWVPEQQPPQVPPQTHYGGNLWGRAVGFNNSHYQAVRYNVVADSAIWGFHNDCNCYGMYLYGNTFWRNWAGGVYNEAWCDDSRILYNAIVENGGWGHGVMLSASYRCLVAYNLIVGNAGFGVGCALRREGLNPLDNVIQHNLIKDSPKALSFEGAEALQGIDLHQLMTMTFDHNIYSLPPGGIFARPGMATLADFQNLTKMDQNSRVDDEATIEDFGLGTVTFRIPDCDDPEEPVPMVVNLMSRGLHAEPIQLLGNDSPLFWSYGHGDSLPDMAWNYIYACAFRSGWPFQRYGRSAPDAVPTAPLPADGEQPFWLEAIAEKPEHVAEEGSGWWSRILPTVPGARISVSLRVSGEDLQPVEGQSVVALVRFSSATDQHVTRQYLIGGAAGEEILKGAFTWKTFSNEFVAPPAAKRFALFFGMRPGTGKVRFAEVRIETLPGEKRAEMLMPENVAYKPIELKDFFNRELDENATGRLQLKGWPRPMDLSQLPRGEQVEEKIPFQIDRGIALRGSMFPQEKSIPREVRGIPVNRKAAGLYFRYRVVYPCPDREQFRFVLHLADGGTVELPFFSGWEAVRQRVKETNVRMRSNYLMEWVNPRPEIAIESIDFVGADTGEPVLLAITAAVEK